MSGYPMVTLHSGEASIQERQTAISDDGEHEVGQEERFKVSTEETLKVQGLGKGKLVMR